MLGSGGLGRPNLAAIPGTEQLPPPPVVVPFGWSSPLAKAATALATIVTTGLFLVPQPTQATISLAWQQPFVKAVSVSNVPQSQLFITPTPPAQIPSGWQGTLAKAPLPEYNPSSWSYVPFNTAQLSVNFTKFGWFAGLPKAPPPLGPSQSYAYVPFNTAQLSVNFTNFGWYVKLAQAPAPVINNPSWSYVPYNTPQVSVSFTNFGWYQQLARAPAPIANQPSWSYVPYNTAQVSVYTNFGWYQQLARAPAVVLSPTSWSYVPSPIQVVPQGWYTQLAHASPRPAVQITWSFVPFETNQFFPPVVEISEPPRFVRDLWDRDEWGNFIPGAGIRQV